MHGSETNQVAAMTFSWLVDSACLRSGVVEMCCFEALCYFGNIYCKSLRNV